MSNTISSGTPRAAIFKLPPEKGEEAATGEGTGHTSDTQHRPIMGSADGMQFHDGDQARSPSIPNTYNSESAQARPFI